MAEIQVRDSVKKLINHEKLLGVKIDSKLNFDLLIASQNPWAQEDDLTIQWSWVAA